MQKLYTADNFNLKLKNKLTNANVCNDGKCYKSNFILTKILPKKLY